MRITPFARLFSAPRTARRALSFCAAMATAGTLVACGDDNGLLSPAFTANETRVFSVWAISGTPATLPASYSFTTESLERPQLLSNGAVNFDIAFDLTTEGKVVMLPVRALVPQPPAGAPVIGLSKSTATFASLSRAPNSGYTNDSTVVVGVNELVLLELRGSGCIYGEPFYAKVVVDSIIAAERRVVLRSLVNRNCGYRALTEGLPKN